MIHHYYYNGFPKVYKNDAKLFFKDVVIWGTIVSVVAIAAIMANYYLLEKYDSSFVTPIDESLQKIFWIAFFASFSVKVPMVPVHIWLPEAHVEAPTAGSVILAGVLLKLGSYGLIRFSMPLFPAATIFYTPLVYTMAAIAVVYTSLTAIRQTDIKRIIIVLLCIHCYKSIYSSCYYWKPKIILMITKKANSCWNFNIYIFQKLKISLNLLINYS